jgi:hypothetical protein
LSRELPGTNKKRLCWFRFFVNQRPEILWRIGISPILHKNILLSVLCVSAVKGRGWLQEAKSMGDGEPYLRIKKSASSAVMMSLSALINSGRITDMV